MRRLEDGIRKISKDVGIGVAAALKERPPGEEPGWRAERLAIGVLHGLDEGLKDDRLRRDLSEAVAAAADCAVAAAFARSDRIEALSERAARAFARGALAELRNQLGPRGEGVLTRTLGASTRRIVRDGARELGTPLLIAAVIATVSLIGANLLRRG